jgi:hypothetical protein
MTDKLIEAIDSWENDYLNCTDDELSTIVNAARSTLTPPDTQGDLYDQITVFMQRVHESIIAKPQAITIETYDFLNHVRTALTRPSREAEINAQLLASLKGANIELNRLNRWNASYETSNVIANVSYAIKQAEEAIEK